MVARPVARVAAADTERDRLLVEVEIAHARLDPQIDLRQILAHAIEARQHPHRGKGGRRRKRYVGFAALGADFLRRLLNARQTDRHVGVKFLPRLGQFHRPVHAVKQRHAQLVFEAADGVGDRRLRHAELACGSGEVLVTAGRLENDEAGGGGKQAAQVFHKSCLSHGSNFSSVTMEFFVNSIISGDGSM
ncbi:hypothetical protein D9M70_400580 [compost metagenome]